jgi:hypothetical protein
VAKRFSTGAPKGIAAIGKLTGTLVDRSIVIIMSRKSKRDRVQRLRRRDQDEFVELRRRATRWAPDNNDALIALEEADGLEVPQALNDRAAGNWRPLLAIAQVAGGACAEEAPTAAWAISGSEFAKSDSTGVERRAAMKAVWPEGEAIIPTKVLLALDSDRGGCARRITRRANRLQISGWRRSSGNSACSRGRFTPS